jgi:sec-independent protein translocase protein TatA
VDVGPAELMIVLLIALLIFGGAKLPKLARSMGEAASEFRKAVRGHDDDEPTNDARDGDTGAADVGNERSA